MTANDGLIKCLDCDFTDSENEFQVLHVRGDYLKCPKCGAENDRLADYNEPKSKGGLMTDQRTELEKEQAAKTKAAEGPATIRLLKAGEVAGNNASRRRGRMFMIAEPIRKLFIPGGITSDMGKGRLSDDTCSMAMKFSQGEYVDLTGKRREHRWEITVENIDHKSEGDCPECGGEMETEILDDNKRRVVCNSEDCGYELSSFCGVEKTE